MASSARAALSEAIEQYGVNGRLLVFHDPGDPFGTAEEWADRPPYGGDQGGRSRLREKVAQANARSRGETL
ncbi:hypothetical protein [Streptomyces ziwulingensis]|uniref:Uncharacterized protein n=1 Tax=Streptomyces ziwulingensis TaxID=1045501 RepID=A0ABP9CQA4_9ACTN